MGLLKTLGSLVGLEADLLLEKAKDNAIAFGAIGVFVAIGVFFLLLALYNWLLLWLGPLYAPLSMAGGALFLALVAFVVVRIRQASIERQEAERHREAESRAVVASAAIAALPDLLANPMVRNIGLPLGIYAALMLFSRPGPRKD